MLVLTRKPGEKLIIGENITITVVAVDRGRVRLAFDAPDDIPILRAELTDRRDRCCGPDLDLAWKPLEWQAIEAAPVLVLGSKPPSATC